jgi:uncharacterized protein CbrC (UPF0167 family)
VESLPQFRYHPDPIATGSIEASDQRCVCCQEARGFVYTSSVYGVNPPAGQICPWCIASGKASAKFAIEYSDGHPLLVAGVPMVIVEEIMLRTPSFHSWQQEEWLSCCGDACEYRGDAPGDEIRTLQESEIAQLAGDSGYPLEYLGAMVRSYEPGGNPCVHKFVCRHCGRTLYGVDGT